MRRNKLLALLALFFLVMAADVCGVVDDGEKVTVFVGETPTASYEGGQ